MNYNINEKALELMLTPEELTSILEIFFSETFEILLVAKNELVESNYAALEKIFHSLKGSSSNFKMTVLADTSKNLEMYARDKNRRQIEKLLDHFETQVVLIEQQIKKNFKI